jgi:hypothetical protein
MNKPVNSENVTAGTGLAVSGQMPAVPGNGAVPEGFRRPLRELMDDRLLDALIERSRDQAGGLRLTGEGSLPGEMVKVVLEVRVVEQRILKPSSRRPHQPEILTPARPPREDEAALYG